MLKRKVLIILAFIIGSKMVATVISSKKELFNSLDWSIEFIENTNQPNAAGIKSLLETIVKPQGEEPKVELPARKLYDDLLNFYNEINDDTNQRGALDVLYKIRDNHQRILLKPQKYLRQD